MNDTPEPQDDIVSAFFGTPAPPAPSEGETRCGLRRADRRAQCRQVDAHQRASSATKVSIVSHKVQTTRDHRARHPHDRRPGRGEGHPNAGDLRGHARHLPAASRRLDRAMVDAAWSGRDGTPTCVCLLIDAERGHPRRCGALDPRLGFPADIRLPRDPASEQDRPRAGRGDFLALTKPWRTRRLHLRRYFPDFRAQRRWSARTLLNHLAEQRRCRPGPTSTPRASAASRTSLLVMLAAEITREEVCSCACTRSCPTRRMSRWRAGRRSARTARCKIDQVGLHPACERTRRWCIGAKDGSDDQSQIGDRRADGDMSQAPGTPRCTSSSL